MLCTWGAFKKPTWKLINQQICVTFFSVVQLRESGDTMGSKKRKMWKQKKEAYFTDPLLKRWPRTQLSGHEGEHSPTRRDGNTTRICNHFYQQLMSDHSWCSNDTEWRELWCTEWWSAIPSCPSHRLVMRILQRDGRAPGQLQKHPSSQPTKQKKNSNTIKLVMKTS